MGRPSACNCNCEEPLPDCFGCIGQVKTITDAQAFIGDSLSWDKPLFQECDIPINVYWPGGLNCDLWGPQFGTECGVLSASGSTHVKFHSAGIEPFGGVNLLQRNPTGSCLWGKRNVKLLKQIWHDSAWDVTFGNFPAVHEEEVVYPYLDPIDANDQWSPIVYDEAFDPRCNTPYIPGPGRRGRWVCQNNHISVSLNLAIVNLVKIQFPSGSLYECWNGIPVDPFPFGSVEDSEKYWELRLVGNHAWAGATAVYSTGLPIGVAGRVSGAVTPYGGIVGSGATLDERNPAKDLAACPPYIKTDSYCVHNTDLFSNYEQTVLRWVKKVDCQNDFKGDPLRLELTTPRKFIDSGAFCQCLDFEINAKKFGLTGYGLSAEVTLLP